MAPSKFDSIPDALTDDVCRRLAENKSVRQPLPGGGMLNIERLLPFLCVYRRDPARQDNGTGLFVTAEAAYLYAPGEASRRKGLRRLVRRIVETASARLASVLILEIWSSEDNSVPATTDELTGEPLLPQAAFHILTRLPHLPDGAAAKLEFALQRIKVNRQAAQVDINLHSRNHPPRMTQLISATEAGKLNCHVLGLEIRPIYRNLQTAEVYDGPLRRPRRDVSRALKQAFFTFALNRTNVRPQHYYTLGRRSLSQRVWAVDRQLAEVSSHFKFLLQVTPVNAERSWHAFSESKFRQEPRFLYRPLETEPLMLKRRLWKIATEQIEDPTLAHLLRQTQDELDLQITMLAEIGTRRFLHGSLQVYGGVEPALLELAQRILRTSADAVDEAYNTVSAGAFVRAASREIQFYRKQMREFTAQAIVRDDMYSGLLSTGGNLLVGRETLIAEHRVEALLHHEIGTHLVTYFNGQFQPLRLLKVGLAGYDALQEGLAVLAEYLVGGLSHRRMRTLAARVVATERLTAGTPFTETFRILVDELGFEPHVAYTIVLRIYRAGGLTKDAVYLRGLVEILDYIARGGQLELLLVGKLAADHIPIVRELLLRGVLRPPPLRPRYLDDPRAIERLTRLQQGCTVMDLLGV